MSKPGLIALALALLLGALPAQADPGSLLALQRYDRTIGNIGYRLAMAGGDLCPAKMPLPGFALHDITQYSADQQDDARIAFGFRTDPLVLMVAPESPAAASGLREGDAILAIDGEPVAPLDPRARKSYARMETILARVDAAAKDGMIDLAIRRGEQLLTIHAPALPGCASRFQSKVSPALDSAADGTYVEITTGIVDFAETDAGIAAIIAHELAHNILRHRERLNAKGIRRGMLGQFGRSARLVRQTEEEADRLSVYLMDRAGYDPHAIITFWEKYRKSHILGFLSAPTHQSPGDRIAVVEEEIARIAAMKAAGQSPRPLFMMGSSLPELR